MNSSHTSIETPMLRTARAAVIALLAVCVGMISAPQAAAETEQSAPTTVWSLTPALEGDQDEPRVSFRFDVPPGESVEDAVELTNFSAQEATFTLEASDGVVSDSGTFDILRPGEENEAAGQWIELDQQEVTVPADETVTIPFTLTVPENATPGDQPAGIAASVSAGDGEEVAMVSRVGSRIHLRVDGDIMPALEVGELVVDYQQNWNPFGLGTATATWTVENTGNIRLGTGQLLQSTGPFGIAAAHEVAEPVHEILPGGEATFRVEQQVFPLFALWSTVELTPNIVGDDVVDAELTNATGTSTVSAIPIPQLILLALIGGLIWWLATRKKRQTKKFEAAVAAAAAARTESGTKDSTDELQVTSG